MSNTVEVAAQIRKELKARGIKARDVSVRSDLYSMGSTIRLRINNPEVSIALVRQIASMGESIHRDAQTGEILGGGNRFVDVEYSSEAQETMAAPYLAALSDEAGVSVTVNGWEVSRNDERDPTYTARKPGHQQLVCWGKDSVARHMAAADASRPRVFVKADCAEVG